MNQTVCSQPAINRHKSSSINFEQNPLVIEPVMNEYYTDRNKNPKMKYNLHIDLVVRLFLSGPIHCCLHEAQKMVTPHVTSAK